LLADILHPCRASASPPAVAHINPICATVPEPRLRHCLALRIVAWSYSVIEVR
jgi:hypothetical protein